jgi:hypothetical protein
MVDGLLYAHRLEPSTVTPTASKEHCLNLLYHMWAPDRTTGEPLRGIHLPNTVYVSQGTPMAWFYSQDGEIKRKDANRIKDRERWVLNFTDCAVALSRPHILLPLFPSFFSSLSAFFLIIHLDFYFLII